jgi:hypothetical protein
MDLSPEAKRYKLEVDRRRAAAMESVARIPIAALIWGPSPATGTPGAEARVQLHDELIRKGHLPQYSEELIDASSPHSIQVQQLSHVEASDIVFSIPDSPGSIAEIHDFAKAPFVGHKIITFLNRQWNDGYANRSLIEITSRVTTSIELYDPVDSPQCIISKALQVIQKLQELYYLLGRRA